ncbi:MAG: sugar phosphate nucleotidyltransferase [Bacteroidota bacterium]|nr:sugar phosphate nucleotidyltransferase [Bacteroidota bacterium]MDP4229921.1 sugar phosphate nucleotidyltransferase [Bacteroidota bacterium]
MKAIIMAGGFGTRLRPLTMSIPKPMVPLMNKPMMEHIVNLLKEHDIRDLTSLLFFQPDAITSYFGDGSAFGVHMRYTRAEADYGTAGSVRNATEQYGIKERIIIISGDVLTDFNLSEAIAFHEKKKAKATIVLTRVKNPLQYGVVITEEDGRVARFLEKPSWGEVFSDTINTGIYILEPEAFERIPYRREHDFSKDLFPLLLDENAGLYGYVASGYWRDIGNLIEYHEAHLDALSGRVQLHTDGQERGNAMIGDGAEVEGVEFYGQNVIGKNVKIAPGCRVLNSVIGTGTTIASGAMIEDTVMWDHVTIGELAYTNHSVICSNSTIGAEAKIHEHVFIGERCQVGEKAEIMPNVKLWPQKQIESGSILHTSLVLEDRWSKALFTNSRISGASNIEITPEFTAKVGASLGALVGMGQYAVVSRDSDPGSRVIARALTSGLMSAGVNVRDLEQTPIPLTRHDLLNGRQAAGIHIRKNPYEKRRSDLIFFDSDGKDLTSTKGKTIERYFFGEDFPRAPFDKVGTIEFPVRTGEAYRKNFLKSVNTEIISKAKFRIAIDYAFGITSTIFPNILGTLGVEVVSLNAYLEPTRLTRAKEEFKRSTEQLKSIVTSLNYDVGFILDSGGERISVVDENGEFHHNQNLLTLVTKFFLESRVREGKPIKKIAVPISASNEIETVAKSYGVEVTYTKNSHAAMMVASNKANIGFVGGTRGGFIFPDYFFAVDGMYSTTKLLEMMARTGIKIGEIAKDLPHRHQARRQAFCPPDQLGTVMRKAMEHTKGMDRTLVDGIRFSPIAGNSAWVLVIPEKERPYCEILADADSQETADVLAEEYSAQVYEWRKSVI